jgi:hypothetical protein
MSSFRVLPVAAALVASGAVLAQQFTEQSASRFPQPDPAEYTNQSTVGDIDGDGDLDILWANGGNFGTPGTPQRLRVYINNGAGVFTDETNARTGGLTGLHRGVELGDCDRDGDYDVIGAQDFNLLPTLLINDGDGFFTSEGATRLPNITLSSSRAQFGDVDNDGDLDLFLTSGTTARETCGQYRLYVNDGTCHYTDATATNVPLVAVCNNMDCIFGDIDGDFDIDIKTASTGNNNGRLYRNDGTGAFTFAANPPESSTYSYDFGDINGDGDLDLLGANALPGSEAELLLSNDGSGTYSDVSGQLSPNQSLDDNDSKFFDYDVDGDLDLVIARLGGGERLYRNNGLGSFALVTSPAPIQQLTDSSLDIDVADFTGDGAYDLITAQGESGSFINRIYINNGAPDTLAPQVVATEQVGSPAGPGPYVVRAAVLDHVTSDRNFFDQGITLNFTVNEGVPQSVEMLHSGGQIYRGVIPPQESGAQVEYWVTAVDWNGNAADGTTLGFGVPNCDLLAGCSGHGLCVANNDCDCDDDWLEPDCSVLVALPAGGIPNGDDIAGSPLRARKPLNGNMRLFWGTSCHGGDNDYAVYEGDLGDYTSHLPVGNCTTGGLRSLVFPLASGDAYYLVVPLNAQREGSYGHDSFGQERAPSAEACRLPGVLTCD